MDSRFPLLYSYEEMEQIAKDLEPDYKIRRRKTDDTWEQFGYAVSLEKLKKAHDAMKNMMEILQSRESGDKSDEYDYPKEIYIITSGEYSGYHICSATTNKERAQELLKIYDDNRHSAEIETYNNGEIILDLFKQGYHPYLIIVFKDQMLKPRIVDEMPPDYSQLTEDDYRYDEYNYFGYFEEEFTSNDKAYTIRLYAKSKEQALKMAYDMIAKYEYSLVEGEENND